MLPQLHRREGEQGELYGELTKVSKTLKSAGYLFVGGDFNARVQQRQIEVETMIGDHTFNRARDTVSQQSCGVAENRQLFLTYADTTNQVLRNTHFPKQDKYLLTYKENKQHAGGEPYSRPTYETLDYITTPTRWKNAIQDITNDLECTIPSDHYPLICNVKLRLKARFTPPTKATEYAKCSDDQKDAYNGKLQQHASAISSHEDVQAWMKGAASHTIPTVQKTKHEFTLSGDTTRLIEQRKHQSQQNPQDRQSINDLTKEIRKAIRQDKRRHLLETVDKDLDIRDRWLGIRMLRKGYEPIPLAMKNAAGKHVPMPRRAEEAAEFLATKIWGRPTDNIVQDPQDTSSAGPIIDQEPKIQDSNITLEETLWAIRKLKRRKAAGPDGVPMEFFKEMQEPALLKLRDLLNEWWVAETVPSSDCKRAWC